jgi:hypothetical protein
LLQKLGIKTDKRSNESVVDVVDKWNDGWHEKSEGKLRSNYKVDRPRKDSNKDVTENQSHEPVQDFFREIDLKKLDTGWLPPNNFLETAKDASDYNPSEVQDVDPALVYVNPIVPEETASMRSLELAFEELRQRLEQRSSDDSDQISAQ